MQRPTQTIVPPTLKASQMGSCLGVGLRRSGLIHVTEYCHPMWTHQGESGTRVLELGFKVLRRGFDV